MQIQNFQPTRINESSSYLEIVANKDGRVTLKVLDVNGRMAKKVTTSVSSGNQRLALDLNDLNNGAYVLNAFNDDEFVKSIRFIKQ
jgi:ribosomal protein S6